MKTQIGLGILAIVSSSYERRSLWQDSILMSAFSCQPYVLHTLGIVPGVLTIFAIAILTTCEYQTINGSAVEGLTLPTLTVCRV
jgi:hypothetical protein